MHCKSKRRARLMEQRRSIHHAKPFSIHFNVYIRENCYIWCQSALAERFKAVIKVTLFFSLFFLAYKSINDCFNIREIVVFIRSREGYNWAIALGTPRVIAQF